MTESSEGFEFDRLTAVSSAGDGRYTAELSPGWVVGGGLNGGYLLAVMGQALRAAVPAKPDPIAVSAYYVSASTPGPATVSVDVRREGGSVATAAVDVVQDGTSRITALATCGDLARFARAGASTYAPLPPSRSCRRPTTASARPTRPRTIRAFVPMLDRFDLRLDPAHAAWGGGRAGHDRRDRRLVPVQRRPRARRALAADRLRRAAASHLRPRHARLGAHPRADRARARPPGARAGSRSATRPATWPAACSRRTARSGTPPAGWSRRAASWPCCLDPRELRPPVRDDARSAALASQSSRP